MTIAALDAQLSSALFGAGQDMPRTLVTFLASYLIWFLGALAVIFLWRRRAVARDFVTLAAGGALAYAVDAVIGLLVFRQRPFLLLGLDPLVNTAHLAGSFPSDHAAIAFSLAAGYSFLDKKNAWLFWALALVVSLGRVVAGVHFAGDVAAGALIGTLAALVSHHRRWLR